VGLRRSYGDSCLNAAGALIDMRGLDRFVSFDSVTGRLRAQAGTTLSEILRIVTTMSCVAAPLAHAFGKLRPVS